MAPLAELIGESPAIRAVRETTRRLLQRQSDSRRLPPILILGETGTGKGLLARAIHREGPRADGPFVDVNCAAIPETLLEAELFGYERGAFTDARQAKPGLFQTANRGTIFLDEVGLLPEGLQAKLLKVLEERSVRRLGSTRSDPVDIWILSATSEDMEAATRARRFREDLYHRLAVLTLGLPPLRERGSDILLLADHFLSRACSDYNLPPKTLAPDAHAALVAYRWPGNIRELSNAMERVALLSEADVVTAEMLGLPAAPPEEPREGARGEETGLKEAVGALEREHLLQALRQTNWNITRAAARLGISRDTLRYRIEKHGLRQRGTRRPASRQAERPMEPEHRIPAPFPAEVAPAVGLRWERRRLTLLRAALIVPATAGSPEASRPLEVVAEKVESFGGRVEELSPMGILAVFGLEPVEDAPRRAALAAVAIQKARERVRQSDTENVAVKLAIHTGQFMVGQARGIPVIDLDTKGRAGVALEALLQQAEPNVILVSDAAAPLLGRHFDLAPVEAPGGSTVGAYRLAGGGRLGVEIGRRMARFVGRRQELELLRSRLAAALRGHPQVVGIVGEAGIGKSRLLFEFRRSLRGERVTYLEARCPSYGSVIPYLPVLTLLRHNFGIAEVDSPAVISKKVHSVLRDLGRASDEWAPYLLNLLGVKEATDRLAGLSPEAIKVRTCESLRQLSLMGSQERPIIFVLEDLHWIDRTSEECIASIAESLASAPILFLSTYRPGYRPPWIDKSYATQMVLEPLSLEESLSLVHSVLQTEEVPDRLAQQILSKAEGNPFFLEELARAVREQGELLPTLTVPDTIEEVLLARINRLPDEPKLLLQAASVLGREFSLRLLGMIWEGPGSLESHFRELMRLEFLYEKAGAQEPVYVFKHALTQEVAYASLLPPRRQALHLAAAGAIEVLYAGRLDEADDRLAYHYSKSNDAAKAVRYLTRFAEKAARAFAHAEAITALQEALAHVERLRESDRDRRRLDLILRLAFSLFPLGRFRESLDILLGEEDRLARLQDPSLSGHYHFLLGQTQSFLGEHERAAQSAQRAIEEAKRSGDEATMGKAYCLLALEGPLSGQALQGIEHGRQALALLERTKEQWWLGHAHWVVALNYTQIGEFHPALAASARAQAIGESIGDPRLQAGAAWVSGIIHAVMGEWEAGIEACQRGLERSPDPLNRAICMGWLGFAYVEKGEPARAIPMLEQSVRELGRFGFQQFQGWFTAFLAEAHRVSADPETALVVATRALEISLAAKFSAGIGWAHTVLGRLAQARGALSDADRHLAEAFKAFASIQSRYELARTHLDLAVLAHAQGKREAVLTHLRDARQLFTSLRIPKYVERAERLAREFDLSPFQPLDSPTRLG